MLRRLLVSPSPFSLPVTLSLGLEGSLASAMTRFQSQLFRSWVEIAQMAWNNTQCTHLLPLPKHAWKKFYYLAPRVFGACVVWGDRQNKNCLWDKKTSWFLGVKLGNPPHILQTQKQRTYAQPHTHTHARAYTQPPTYRGGSYHHHSNKTDHPRQSRFP